jgi:hypothetical protein
MSAMNFGYRSSFQLIDKGNIEVFGPAGSAFNLQALGKNFANYQSGFVSNYALSFMLALMLVLCFFTTTILGVGVPLFNEAFLVVLFGYSVFCFIV